MPKTITSTPVLQKKNIPTEATRGRCVSIGPEEPRPLSLTLRGPTGRQHGRGWLAALARPAYPCLPLHYIYTREVNRKTLKRDKDHIVGFSLVCISAGRGLPANVNPFERT
jgi:hypothetical protein